MRRKNRRGRFHGRSRDGIAEMVLRSPRVDEQTNAEALYLQYLIRNRSPVVVKLVSDEEITGWIEYYDKNFIRVTRHREPNVFVFKDKIKYLWEQ